MKFPIFQNDSSKLVDLGVLDILVGIWQVSKVNYRRTEWVDNNIA